MALPSDSYSSATTGTTFATQPFNGKEVPVGVLCDSDGHLRGSQPAYGVVIPPAAVGASKVFFDIHNAMGSGTLRLRYLAAIVATDVAITGTLGVRLDMLRTSNVGTGGTVAATAASTATTAPAIWPLDGASAIPAGLTARTVPTGGATTSQWLWPNYIFTEETNMSSQVTQFYNLIPQLPMDQPLVIPNGQGFKVVQGTVASAGTVGFLAVVTVA